MKTGFLMALDQAEEFWKRCIAANATTEEEKTRILVQMFQEDKAVCLGQTPLTAPELATELIKKGYKAKSYIKGTPKCPKQH